jgi:tRNA(Arg) A34 adenosine deaminase TadA
MKKLEYLETLYQRACRAARKSGMNHRHGAIVIHDGVVVAEGFNYESPDFKDLFSIHAEMDALTKVKHLGKSFLSQCEMMVVRIGPATLEHTTKLSMPCPLCRPMIERMGIRKVYYTTNEEFDEAIRTHTRYTHVSSKILNDRNKAMERSARYTVYRDAAAATAATALPPPDEDSSGSDTQQSPRHGRARRATDQRVGAEFTPLLA